jgi:ABC-2 type transport system permease protein
MLKALLVAQREFMENVRTKSFWFGILVFPVLITLFVVAPRFFERTRGSRQYAVVDHSGWLLAAMTPGLARADRYERINAPRDTSEAGLAGMVSRGELFAYFVIERDPIEAGTASRYVSNNLTDGDLRQFFSRLASEQVQLRRAEREAVDPDVAKWIQEPVLLEHRRVSKSGELLAVEPQDRLRQWAPVVFVYLLWVSVFTISQMLLTNTVEEKSNRIIEVLLSSVSPLQLMGGKILGIAATGLTIVASWIAVFMVVTRVLPRFLDMPSWVNLADLINDPVYLGAFALYFLLGYLLYAALLVAIGSVCNTLKEAQNLMGPITILLILPLLTMTPIGRDPNGMLAKVLSFVPVFTPFVMMNRAAGPPAPWEYAATTVVLLTSIGVALWAAAKVFRVGVLLTGKPPGIREIARWVRAPVGRMDRRSAMEPGKEVPTA